MKQEGEEKQEEIDSENTIVDYNEGDDLAGVTKEQFPAYRFVDYPTTVILTTNLLLISMVAHPLRQYTIL